jgi:hypothetical protein
MDSFTEGNWRKVMTISCISPLIATISIFIIMIESPRLKLATGNYEVGFKNLDYIGKKNHGDKYSMLSTYEKN